MPTRALEPVDAARLSARARHLSSAFCMFLTGAIVVGDRGLMLVQGRWEWPAFVSGVVLLGAAVASAPRRPTLASVVGAQGITAAFLAHHAFVSAFGARSVTSLLAAALSLGALTLGAPLLEAGRTTSRFAPTAHRRLLLVGTVASVAVATFLSTSALYRAHVGWLLGKPELVASALFCGSLALLQGTCAFAILRMRGIALVLGLAAALLSVLSASAFISLPNLICALVALVALATPLLRRSELDRAPGLELPLPVRVASAPDEDAELASNLAIVEDDASCTVRHQAR